MSWKLSKSGWAKLCVLLVGVVLVLFPWENQNNDNAVLSVGCSLIATAVASILLDLAQEHNISEVHDLAKKTYTDLSHLMETLGNVHTLAEDTYTDLSRFMETLDVNSRIVTGRHLRETVPKAVEQELRKSDLLEVDVMGLELYNFWKEQSGALLARDKVHIRLLVQDPCSPFFDRMIENERVSPDAVKTNIQNLTRIVRGLQGTLTGDRKVDIRWLYFPASATITRVNDQLYIRTRLIDSAHIDDDNFFEKYVKGERPYDAFRTYFENAWKQWDDPSYSTFREAKIHFNAFVATLEGEKPESGKKGQKGRQRQ